MKSFFIIILISICSLPAFSNETLYTALGEHTGIQAIIQRAVNLAAEDVRTAQQLRHTNKERLARLIAEQTCELSGGPCKYKGLTMKKAHYKLYITSSQFDAFAEHLQQSMQEADLDITIQSQLLAVLAPLKKDIINQ
ncbi:group I truncated hemoglobin [Kordiimonas aquimaris]|uniref:group I truncated hemoglobin n=1 Tax=Kordiimonas aquimaris TaxID=707591 RepID=UPI0021D30256|nr:group 1 truncated hemoglobin [Kordiimonas aquimaris]